MGEMVEFVDFLIKMSFKIGGVFKMKREFSKY